MTEPEEILEAKIVADIANAAPGVDVLGALSAAPEGEQKLSPDSYISVFADVASQLLDWSGPNLPRTFSVRVTVHVADADDKTHTLFRDACRAVRGVLKTYLGDGCEALTADGLSVDGFSLDTTETAQDASSDVGGMAKSYNATVTARYNPPVEEADETQTAETPATT